MTAHFRDDDGPLFAPKPTPIPHAKGSSTSAAAAESVRYALGALEAKVYECIKSAGDRGRTTDEVEQLTGLPHQTASARVNGLANPEREGGALIYLTDQKRPTRSKRQAGVYRAK